MVGACGVSCSAARGILVPGACMLGRSVTSDSLQPTWTIACRAPLSMGFPRQDYWRGLPFPLPGDLPNSMSSSLQGRFLITGPPRKSHENEKVLNRCQAVHLPDSSWFKIQRALQQRPPGWPSFLSIVEILWKPSSVQASLALVSCKTSAPGLVMPSPEAMKFTLEPVTILRPSVALSHFLELTFSLLVVQFDNCLDYTNWYLIVSEHIPDIHTKWCLVYYLCNSFHLHQNFLYFCFLTYIKSYYILGLPWSPVVKILPSNTGVVGSILGWGAKITHASWPKNLNIKQKQYCSKFNEGFKNGPH